MAFKAKGHLVHCTLAICIAIPWPANPVIEIQGRIIRQARALLLPNPCRRQLDASLQYHSYPLCLVAISQSFCPSRIWCCNWKEIEIIIHPYQSALAKHSLVWCTFQWDSKIFRIRSMIAYFWNKRYFLIVTRIFKICYFHGIALQYDKSLVGSVPSGRMSRRRGTYWGQKLKRWACDTKDHKSKTF